MLFFEYKFHFRMTSVKEIFDQLNLSFRLKKNKNIVHVTFVIARLAF